MKVTYFDLANTLLHKNLADLIIYFSDKECYSAMVNGVIEGHTKNVWSDSVGAITAVVTVSLIDGVDRQEITMDKALQLLDKLIAAQTAPKNHTT